MYNEGAFEMKFVNPNTQTCLFQAFRDCLTMWQHANQKEALFPKSCTEETSSPGPAEAGRCNWKQKKEKRNPRVIFVFIVNLMRIM